MSAETPSDQNKRERILQDLPGNGGNGLLQGLQEGQISDNEVLHAVSSIRAKTMKDFGGNPTSDRSETYVLSRLPAEQAESVEFLLDALEEMGSMLVAAAQGELELRSDLK